jgi:hypothetical protein
MIGSAGNVVRQAEADSVVVVAVIRDAENYVCNRCLAAVHGTKYVCCFLAFYQVASTMLLVLRVLDRLGFLGGRNDCRSASYLEAGRMYSRPGCCLLA